MLEKWRFHRSTRLSCEQKPIDRLLNCQCWLRLQCWWVYGCLWWRCLSGLEWNEQIGGCVSALCVVTCCRWICQKINHFNWSIKCLSHFLANVWCSCFSNMRICFFSLFHLREKKNLFRFWTVGQTKQNTERCHIQYLDCFLGFFFVFFIVIERRRRWTNTEI